MKRTAFILLLVLGAIRQSYGQSFDVSMGAQTGRQSWASYFDTDIDSVSLYNGNLNLDITLFELPGRELSKGLRLIYNSQKWEWTSPYGYPYGIYTGGWHLYNPAGYGVFFDTPLTAGCDEFNPDFGYFKMDAYWLDPLGTKRWFKGNEGWKSCSNPLANEFFYSTDDGGSHIVYDQFAGPIIRLRDGTAIPAWDMTVLTANGNSILGNIESSAGDTLGRTVAFETNKTPSSQSYYKKFTITGADGQPQVYQLNYGFLWPVWNPLNNTWQQINDMLLSVDLPNGTHYWFEYDTGVQGFLKKVTLPTGGWIRYVYGGSPFQPDPFHPDSDKVVARYISTDGTNEQTAEVYERNDVNAEWRIVNVRQPLQDYEENSFFKGLHIWNLNRDSSDHLDYAVERSWLFTEQNGRPINPLLDTVTTHHGMVRTTSFQYTPWPYSVSQQDETDWGWPAAGELLSRTTFSYTTVDNVYQRPTVIEVSGKNPVNQQFEVQGRTEFEYDQSPLFITPAEVPGKWSPAHPSRLNLTTLRKFTGPAQAVMETFKYDDLGNVREHTDPMNHTTFISYQDSFSDAQDRNTFAYPTQVTSAASHVSKTVYDWQSGAVTKTIDARNLQTVRTYDGFSRPKTITLPNGRTTTYDYDDITPKVIESAEVIAGNFRKMETSFDKFYKATKVVQKDPSGDIYTDTEYDLNGRLKRTSLPYRFGEPVRWKTVTTYDGINRARVITNPDNTTVQISYENNSVLQTDESGNQRRLIYNALGQLIQVQEPNPTLTSPLVTNYSYYVFGPVASVNQSGQTRTFTHDWLGRKFSETHPESGTTTYQVDNDGRITQRKDARNISANYAYDAIDRLLGIDYDDSTPDVTYSYDQNSFTGFLTTVSDGAGTTTFTYNNAGQVISEARTFSGVTGAFTTSYEFYNDGQLSRLAYPSGRQVEYPRKTGSGLVSDDLSSVTDNVTSTTLLQNMQYNAAGQMTSRNFGNQAQVTHAASYNERFQLAGIGVMHNNTPLMSFIYGYGPQNNGKVLFRYDALHPEHSAQYAYDSLQRLKQVTASTWSISWQLDAFGNRTSQTPTGIATSKVGTQTLGYSGNRNNSFDYDAAGNVTGDGLHTYTYDAEGRIKQVDGGAVQYAYDSGGRRIKKTVGSQSTYYIYGATGLLSEFTTAASGASQAAANDHIVYYVPEQTDTGVLQVEANGNILEHNRVLPYGEFWEIPPNSTNELKFTTYLRDQETGNDYAMSRYYANRYGRFISPDLSGANIDLADPQSWNAYAYVNGDPIDFTDPSGEGFWSKLLGIGLSIAGFFTGGTTTVLGKILMTASTALTGTSVALGQTHVSGTPPFNPSAQNVPLGVFGTPPLSTSGVFKPPVIVKPQLIYDLSGIHLQGPLFSRDSFDGSLPSWLPAWAKALLWGMWSEPTPLLFPMEVPVPASSAYIPDTIGRSVRNIFTNVTPEEFGTNLEASGWVKSISKDGKAVVYSLGSKTYSVYARADSTGGPTAQLMVLGRRVLKIRLK